MKESVICFLIHRMYHEEIFGVCAFCSFKVLEGGDTQSFRSACNDPRLGEANYKEVTYFPKDFKYVPRKFQLPRVSIYI